MAGLANLGHISIIKISFYNVFLESSIEQSHNSKKTCSTVFLE